ncbi:MAG: DUF368 domain-containing protein [Acidobacteriota bacterium]|nr:DUF368 domain-containing protein [Acidobacteriota bacterium]
MMTFVDGVLIGIANIIPGVSGGTFALILGIFDRLVGAINNLSPRTFQVALDALRRRFDSASRQALAAEWRRLDAGFLVLLGLGAVVAILSCSFLIDYLLKVHYSPTLAFFIGLILPSVSIPWSMMEQRGMRLGWALPGVALTLGISLVAPGAGGGTDNLLVAFLAGAIAISAMILPGISGSYVLLVMGQYQVMLNKLTGFQRGLADGRIDLGALAWLLSLVTGLAVGIVLFARLLNYLLDHRRSATMAFLIGLLIGSLWVLWPFKEIAAGAAVTGRDGEVKQEIRIATAPNRLPETGAELALATAALAAGLVGSGGLIALGRRRREGRREEGA